MFETFERLFGGLGAPRRLGAAPRSAKWRDIHPTPDGASVSAHLAQHDGAIERKGKKLYYKAGQHYLVEYGPGDVAPVERSVFERVYMRTADARFEKRSNLRLRYFTLPYTVEIETKEGVQRAEPGDWIVEGVEGELWPIAREKAEQRYSRI